jgi:hypothetical protein
VDTRERVDRFLAHYSSDNYDPVKAHEYYLKNRELKGRAQNTTGMSEVQKEAWSYTKHKIGEDKKAELAAAQEAQKARLEALRVQAEETRDRIKQKLESLIKKLKSTPFVKIPENVSPQTRQRLLERNQKIAANNQKLGAEKSAVVQQVAREELKKVGADLKNALATARSSYEASKKDLNAKYEAVTNTEYENIRTKLPSAPPPVKKPPAVKKASTTKRKPRAKKAEVVETEDPQSLTKTQ